MKRPFATKAPVKFPPWQPGANAMSALATRMGTEMRKLWFCMHAVEDRATDIENRLSDLERK